MIDDILYDEEISSYRTSALFFALALIFFLLMFWRTNIAGFDFWSGLFIFLTLVFLFYTINYWILHIQINLRFIKLRFGVFTWRVLLDNIARCSLDEIPGLMKYGGAGIHFMVVGSRYRASFNFLEYPRVVIQLKRKKGLVQDISFSTRNPQQVLHLIQARLQANLPGT